MKTAWGFWPASWGATRRPSTCELHGHGSIHLSCLLHGREVQIHDLSTAVSCLSLILLFRRCLCICRRLPLALGLGATVGVNQVEAASVALLVLQ